MFLKKIYFFLSVKKNFKKRTNRGLPHVGEAREQCKKTHHNRSLSHAFWDRFLSFSVGTQTSRNPLLSSDIHAFTFSTIQIYKYLCGCGSKKNLCGRNIHEECIDLFDKTVRMVVKIWKYWTNCFFFCWLLTYLHVIFIVLSHDNEWSSPQKAQGKKKV